MGICTDACDCYLEGERGLEGDGVGTLIHPYVWTPSPDRTIPRTVDTFADLNDLDVEEVGLLEHTTDTGLVYAYQPITEGGLIGSHWAIAGDWNEFLIPDQTVPLQGDKTTYQLGTLRPGMWDVIITGYAVVELSADSLTVVVARLFDVPSNTAYRQSRMTCAEDSGFDNARTMPFTLQHVLSSGPGSDNPSGTTKTLAIDVQRVTSPDDNAASLLSLKCRIRRLASHSSF